MHERYFFQEYIFKYEFRYNKENVNSLDKNHPTCEKSKDLSCTINEEVINTFADITWNMWKKCYSNGDENTLDTPLKEETDDHEVEHQLSQGDCREVHKEEGEDKLTILVDGGCENQRESTDGCS